MNGIAAAQAKRIFEFIGQVPRSAGKEDLLNNIHRRAEKIIKKTPIPKRIEHTILETETGYAAWHERRCLFLHSQDQTVKEQHGRTDFFAELKKEGGGALLLVKFLTEKKPSDINGEAPARDHVAGRLSEISEAQLALFLESAPDAGNVIEKTLCKAIEDAEIAAMKLRI
jgi:hypothetical protein